MEMTVSFSGGRKLAAQAGGFVVMTDQPEKSGGENSAPTPFQLFLVSIATCSAYYVLDFCRNRDIPLDGVTLVQRSEYGRESKKLEKIVQEIRVPRDFPGKYHTAVVRASELCTVKKAILDPPEMSVEVVVRD